MPLFELAIAIDELVNYSLFDYSIVAVHGLNGHREKTWMVDNVNWLRDFLPLQIPDARILSWGYDVTTHSTSPISHQYLYDHATTLVSDLCLERRLTKVLRSCMQRSFRADKQRRLGHAPLFLSLIAWGGSLSKA